MVRKYDVASAQCCHCDIFSDVQGLKNCLNFASFSAIYYSLSTHPSDFFFSTLSFTSLNEESSPKPSKEHVLPPRLHNRKEHLH